MLTYRAAKTTRQIGLLIMLSSLLTACSNLALQALNTPSYLFSQHHVTRDIAYGEASHQTLDLYVPTSAENDKNTLVVFIYGGSWTSGKKESYYFVADALTKEGYSVAIPDYIKYPDATFPVFVDDIALATAWLVNNAANYLQDSSGHNDLFLMGHSAGAHTAALLITDPDYLRRHGLTVAHVTGFIGLAGPYGFIPKEQKYRNIFSNLADFSVMQPQRHVSGAEPPVLVLHGESDTTVLPVNSHQFSEKINDTGGEADAIIYPDTSHVAIVLALSRVVDREGTVLADILTFLKENSSD